MPDEADIENAIATNATGPASARGDLGEMRQHPLADQIAADQYVRANKGAALPHLGLRRVKMVPPGTVF